MKASTAIRHGRAAWRVRIHRGKSATVDAGTFPRRRFRWHFEEAPPFELWNSGPDLFPVKVRWDLLKPDYYLVEFSTD